jgi:hydrogenase nickel incorporation protein HypB
MSIITIERKVLEKNDAIAQQNRRIFAERHILAINLVSSPGSGKTSLLERTLDVLGPSAGIAVIEGDVQTDLDARRIARFGVPVVQIVTNGACHLDAQLVHDALARLPLEGIRLVFIENVGNLICPANYDLGEAMKVLIISTTEGDEKPLKYPALFLNASVLIVNKMDLVPYCSADPSIIRANARKVNPALTMFETSCTTNEGIDAWCQWLTQRMDRSGG